MTTILVAGAKRVDAGKTTFTAGLVAALDAVGFKPRAGTDRWFHHDVTRESVAAGRLFGTDARRLAAASPGDLRPEDVNAVHRLWQPAPGGGTGILGREDREFLVDRVGDRYVRNGTGDLPETLESGLPLEDAIVVDSLADLNDVMERLHVPVLREIGEQIRAADTAVVESYGDVARPLRDLAPDLVAVVEPRRVRYYDGERYRKACEVAPGGRRTGQLERRVGSVVDLIDPFERLTLPPIPGEARDDPATIRSAYGEHYDALLGRIPASPDSGYS